MSIITNFFNRITPQSIFNCIAAVGALHVIDSPVCSKVEKVAAGAMLIGSAVYAYLNWENTPKGRFSIPSPGSPNPSMPPPSQPVYTPLPAQLIMGSMNQNSQTLVTEERPLGGQVACGPIAAFAALAMLKKEVQTADHIDAIVQRGAQLHREIMGRATLAQGVVCSIEQTVLGTELEASLDIARCGNCFTSQHRELSQKESATNTFAFLLDHVEKAAIQKNEAVAGILTLTPSTYAVQYDPKTKSWHYFNSHGDDPLFKSSSALMASFPSAAALANYLATKKYYIDPSEARNKDINQCGIYIVSLKK